MAFIHRFAASVDDLNAHITKSDGAHNATSISTSIEIDGNTYTNVYDALAALASGGGGGGAETPDATSSVKGKLQLTNHLAGTASLPKVVQFELTTPIYHDPQTTGSMAYYAFDGYDGYSNPTYAWRVLSGAPYPGYYLSYNSTTSTPEWTVPTGTTPDDATTIAKGIVQLAGDIAGTATSVTVEKVNGTTVPAGGSLVTGQILRVSGPSAMTYGALDLANSNARTGILPGTNVTAASGAAVGVVQLTADLGGTSTSPVVAKANGATVPAAGALVTGNVLKVSGTSALSYGAVNLAGGANHVTGVLPSANLPDATDTVKGVVKLTNHLSGTADVPKVVQFELTTFLDYDPAEYGAMAYYGYDGYDVELNPTFKWGLLPRPSDIGSNHYFLGFSNLGTSSGPVWTTIDDLLGTTTVFDKGTYIIRANSGCYTTSTIDSFSTFGSTPYLAKTIPFAADTVSMVTVTLNGRVILFGVGSPKLTSFTNAIKITTDDIGATAIFDVTDLTPVWTGGEAFELPTLDYTVNMDNELEIRVIDGPNCDSVWSMETTVRTVSL